MPNLSDYLHVITNQSTIDNNTVTNMIEDNYNVGDNLGDSITELKSELANLKATIKSQQVEKTQPIETKNTRPVSFASNEPRQLDI
jgi:hypothetical protein